MDTLDREASIKLLIAALRSGVFAQGRDRLITSIGGLFEHCCLGVWCAITPGTIQSAIVKPERTSIGFTYGDSLDEHCSLPQDLARKLRVDQSPILDGIADRDHQNIDLVVLNDEGFTFNQIADLIEYFGLVVKDWEE